MARIVGKPRIRKDIETLRSDASRMIEDLGVLSRHIADSGRVKSEKIVSDVGERVARNLESFKSSLDDLSAEGRDLSKVVSTKVREHPIAFAAVGLAIAGVVGALFLIPRKR